MNFLGASGDKVLAFFTAPLSGGKSDVNNGTISNGQVHHSTLAGFIAR